MSETLTVTHGCSLSNLPLFVAVGAGLLADEGLRVEAPHFEDVTTTAALLASGKAQIGTASFIQPLMDAATSAPTVLVSGSGLMGVVLLSRPSVATTPGLAGKRVGTFRADPMELLLFDALAAEGMAFEDVELIYLPDLPSGMEMFERGELDALTLAEPHASRVRAAGANQLSDGTELWGDPFPDTVLVAAESLLLERPHVVSAVIRAMLEAEQRINDNLEQAIRFACPFFPGYGEAELVAAARLQPPCVDIRPLVPVVFDRWPTLQALGLATDAATPPSGAVRLELLAQACDHPRVPPTTNRGEDNA